MELPIEIIESIFHFVPLDELEKFDNEISRLVFKKDLKELIDYQLKKASFIL